jgi:hypothetical protein
MDAVVIVVSPNGEHNAPKAPLANTAPTVNGMDAPVETAKDIPKGINNPHVPQEEPIKYPIIEPSTKIVTGVKNAGKNDPKVELINFEKPRSSADRVNDQMSTSRVIASIIWLPPSKK